ncbi:uncharacterized protein LOC134684409 [Mytilus trossulus]|uniref:uncharacterized protein LOC134684409 n=1 Tax=Mytilus trossulus TaxID=6551 RepID=UPI003005D1DE
MELKRKYAISAVSLVIIIAWILIPNNVLQTVSDKTTVVLNVFGNRKTATTKSTPKLPLNISPTDPLEVIRRDCVKYWYFDSQYLGKTARSPVWTEKGIEDWIISAKKGKLRGNYGAGETNALRDALKHAPGIVDGRVMVIGSENPWVEACVLEAGAREVFTLEYGSIKSEHPKVKTIVPLDFRMRYLNNTLGTFDAIVTFSSIEHSGLGRYGDALNPWGDIIAIARSWCVTKPGGSLTIGVQYNYDHEYLRFNADRWYGKIRYPYLTTNWKQHYRGKGSQRVHVFTK